MIGKNKLDPDIRDSNNSVGGQTQVYNFTKPYSNYVNYQGNAHTPARQSLREPDHVALYSINTNPHPNLNSLTINRNPYINGPFQLRKQPPKQTLTRNSSNKDQYPSRQSQELIRNKTQNIKSAHKNNSISSKGLNTSLNGSVKIANNNQIQNSPYELGQAYSQTVDLGSISRKHSMNQSAVNNEQELLNQKIQYLSLLDRSLRDFERVQDIRVLQHLSQNNKKIMVGYFEQLNRLKEQKSRKTISDMVSESDNFSEDAFSIDQRSDSRNTSLRIQSEKNKFSDGLQKSRDRFQGKDDLNHLVKLNEKLERQHTQLLNAKKEFNNQMIQIQQGIKSVQSQTSKLQAKAMELKTKLSGLPFYQQWVLMSNEEEGARKIQIKLKEELEKRRMKLKQLKQQDGGRQQLSIQRKGSQQKLKERSQLTKQRQSSQSKLKSPIPNIPIAPTSQPQNLDSQANRIIQDSSLRIMGVSHQVRNKSINRSLNN